MIDFSKYINLKFKYKGRGFDGVDCYGLVWLILNTEKQLELPEYEYSKRWYTEGKNYIVEIKKDINNWAVSNIEQIRPFDVILFYNSSNRIIVNHMGLYVGENKFIHVNEDHNSILERLDDMWLRRIYAIMRYSKEGTDKIG